MQFIDFWLEWWYLQYLTILQVVLKFSDFQIFMRVFFIKQKPKKLLTSLKRKEKACNIEINFY